MIMIFFTFDLTNLLLLSSSLLLLLPQLGNALAPVIVHSVCGFTAGSLGAFAAYPIDFVKSQLQTESGRQKYQGGLQAAFDICKQDGGILNLYRGAMVNVVGVAPEKTIKLSVNNAIRVALRAHYGTLPILGEILAGGAAGMTQVLVTNPLELIKVRMQTSQMTVKDVLEQVKSFADIYQGAGACVVRDATFSAILFPLYAHAKIAIAALLVASGGDTMDSSTAILFWADMIAGSIAAAPAAALSTPADVVKTRLQQAREEEVTSYNQQPKHVLSMLKLIVEQEGPAVLMSGWFERVVRSVPQFGVTLAVFDILNDFAIQHGWMIADATM